MVDRVRITTLQRQLKSAKVAGVTVQIVSHTLATFMGCTVKSVRVKF